MPTFNRVDMLREALKSIETQTAKDWELIIIDDGSTEQNREVCEAFSKKTEQSVTYLFQENQGPGVARQQGLQRCRGEYIAFMDSDDPWYCNHLEDCVAALNANVDIDWVIAPAKIVDERVGKTIDENSFFQGGKHLWLLDLKFEKRGELYVVIDPRFVEKLILNDFLGGLQSSVFRSSVAEKVQFLPLRLFDDTAFEIEAFGNGFRLGYFLDVQSLYRIHHNNTSFVGGQPASLPRRVQAYECSVGFCRILMQKSCFNQNEIKAFRKRISEDLFWKLGYATYLAHGLDSEANNCFRTALSVIRWRNFAMCKTYFVQKAKRFIRRIMSRCKTQRMII